MELFRRELSYACRRLRRSPGYASVVIITLALGIGANAAVFSVLDPLVLRFLPVDRPAQLVLLQSSGTLHTVDVFERPALDQFDARRDVLTGVLADAGLSQYDVAYNGSSESVQGELVSAGYFSVLGVRPYQGRLLGPEDGVAGRQVLVLSFDYWRRFFRSDPTVMGTALTLKGRPFVIIGVAPPEFTGLTLESRPDFYAPVDSGLARVTWTMLVARLQTGVSAAQGQTMLEPVLQQLASTSSLPVVEREQAMTRLLLSPAGRGLSSTRSQFSAPAWSLMVIVGLVLLVACANVANLTLARIAGRQTEGAIRLALGASSASLVRPFMIESAILATLGGAFGLGFARLGVTALVASMPRAPMQTPLPVALDGRVLIFTTLVLMLTMVLSGVAPALMAVHPELITRLKSRDGFTRHSDGRLPSDRFLVVAQIAISVALLIGGGLFLRSLLNLNRLDVGFEKDRVLTFSLADAATGRPNTSQ